VLKRPADTVSPPGPAPLIGHRIELPLLIAMMPAHQHLPVSTQPPSDTPGFTNPARHVRNVSQERDPTDLIALPGQPMISIHAPIMPAGISPLDRKL
jgi:hypothetical protein